MNRIHLLVEGEAQPLRSVEPAKATIAAVAPEAARSEPDPRVLAKSLLTLEGKPAPLDGPGILVLFSVSCHACVDDLKRMRELEQRARELGVTLTWVTIDPDWSTVGEEFRLNGAPVQPLRLSIPVSGIATPTVYRFTPEGVEKSSGRFAVTAALAEEAARRK